MSRSPGLSGWVQCSHKSPYYKKEVGGSEEERGEEVGNALRIKKACVSQGMCSDSRNWKGARNC